MSCDAIAAPARTQRACKNNAPADARTHRRATLSAHGPPQSPLTSYRRPQSSDTKRIQCSEMFYTIYTRSVTLALHSL